MRDGISLAELLELEDDPAFIELACPTTGVLVWPAIRESVFRLMIGERYYSDGPPVDIARRPSAPRLLSAAARSAAHALRHRAGRSDVLILSNGAGLEPSGTKTFNRYVDHFADELGPRAWTAEMLAGDRWPAAPRANDRLSFRGADRLRWLLAGQVRQRRVHRELARDLVALVVHRGRERLDWTVPESRVEGLERLAARRIASYPSQAASIARLLDAVRPRILMLSEGCYGHTAVTVATARQRGVIVAEYQHGLVSRGHDAYNVAPMLTASAAYRMTMPDTFLAYGPWWTDRFNAPVGDRVVIGSPHRSEVLRTWQPDPHRDAVLVLGDGVDTEASLAWSRRIGRELAAPLRIVYRPHPLERARIARSDVGGVEIDQSVSVYDSFRSAVAVLGEASTALFEAVGLVPNIFAIDTAKSRFHLPEHPFERLASTDDLAEMLAASSAVVGSGLEQAVWAPDWRTRFSSWVDRARLSS